MTEEQYLYAQLAELRRSYEKAAKPIIDRLVYLKSLEPLPPFVVPASSLPAGIDALATAKVESANP